jgi:hypothetical protein
VSNRKLPADAFEAYFALGPNRSYAAVAEKFGVSRKAVGNAATRERWNERIAERERKAQERMDAKAVDELVAMRERHLKIAGALQRKGLEALNALPMQTSLQAMKAILAGLAEERLARGEASDRTTVNVEAVIKREYERWLTSEPTENLEQK